MRFERSILNSIEDIPGYQDCRLYQYSPPYNPASGASPENSVDLLHNRVMLIMDLSLSIPQGFSSILTLFKE